MRIPRPRIADPGLASLKSAVRAAIVLPAVFALADKVIGNPQASVFAAFGSFAILVFVSFSGPARSRLTAYLTLAVSGAVLIVVGTLCSQNAWLAAAAMAVVGFLILFSGAINGYFAAGATGAILLFVLPVSIPVPLSELPWRLAGWGLAAGIGICALMLLWPPRQHETLRGDAARACAALADLADVVLSGSQQATQPRDAAAAQALEDLRKKYEGMPHRPTGPARQAAALAALVDELAWLLVSLRAVAASLVTEACRAENRETMAAVAAVLRASGGQLAGRDERPDAGPLEAAQEAVVQALARQISQLPPVPDDEALESLLGHSFRTRAISGTTRQIASYALTASGAAPARSEHQPAAAVVRQYAVEHAGTRSVQFRNSIRGAAGLAVAVFIAQRAGLQHSFWVVLGTLSVLRSNALGTGKSVLGALAGTAAGIVVGAAILLAVGSSAGVLWGVFPVAVLVATYAPRVISFAVGQAAFTVVLVVLFNLIQPIGWKVGLIRIEDVGIGFAVSLGVGLVFWPRGAATVLRENMAAAYSRGADYVAVTARLLTGDRDSDPGQDEQAAATAVHRLDDAFRQYLAERSAGPADPESAARLVSGASRLLRAGRSMAALGAMAADEVPDGRLGRYGETLEGQVQALRSWYVTLGDSLAHGTSVPPPQPADPQSRRLLIQYVRDSIADGDTGALRGTLYALWASQHVDMLRRQEAHLGEQAVAAPGTPSRG